MTTRSRAVATLVAVVLLLLSVPVAIASATSSPTPAANPDLAASCGTDVTIVIDRSGSIGGNNTTVQAAAQTFSSALIGTGSKVQVISFSDRATAEPGHSADLADLAFVDPATLAVPTFPSSGTTNWDDALELVRRSPAGHAPLTVMITDGDPTRRNETQPDGHGDSLAGDGSTSQADLDAAVTEANLVKAQPAHLFVVGVGSAVSNANSKARLQAISGPDELTFSGDTPSIGFGAADFTLVEDFAALKTTVARFVRELCGPSLNVVKQLQLADGTTVAATGADHFTFDVAAVPTPAAWTSPAQAPVAGATLATSGGVANFAWDPATSTSATTITLAEQPAAGWVYNGQRCWLNDLDGSPARLVVDDVGANTVGASKPAAGHVLPAVGAYQAMNCEVFNRQRHTPAITVTKHAQSSTVPAPGGPVVFDVSVTNTSADPVTLEELSDVVSALPALDVTAVDGSTCVLPQVVPVGGSYECSFPLTVTGTEGDVIGDEVTATARGEDGDDVSASASAEVTITAAPPAPPAADLVIVKEATIVPTVELTGQYTLSVTNLGPSDATDVTVVDPMPEALTATSAAGEGWACTVGDGTSVECTRLVLSVGPASPIVVEVAVGDPGPNASITNTATVSSPVPDPDLTNNTDTVTLVPNVVLDASSPPPVVSADLPRTGTDVRGWVIAADLLLILGVAALLADAKRRTLP